MKGERMPAIATVIGVLAVVGGWAISAQDKYTVKVPNGLAFSEFRGYEAWQVVSISQDGDLIAVILALHGPDDAVLPQAALETAILRRKAAGALGSTMIFIRVAAAALVACCSRPIDWPNACRRASRYATANSGILGQRRLSASTVPGILGRAPAGRLYEKLDA